MTERLDRWVSAEIRNEIERRYYAKVSQQADFNRLARDPAFMADPGKHVGIFSDHGIVHARDVANQVLDVLGNCHGVLIPQRNARRFGLMQGYGVLLAYFHDIGMVDFSEFGRSMHPEFATQAVFDPALDDLIDAIWQENSAGLAWQLRTLADQGILQQDPYAAMREMLALSICHSKSKVPVAMLNEPARLREAMIEVASTDLHYLYAAQQARRARYKLENANDETREKWYLLLASAEANLAGVDEAKRQNPCLTRFYNQPQDAFRWLVDENPILQELVVDVVDTLRCLRCADALRQRGSVLVTSGKYQIFVDHRHGSAVYGLRLGDKQMYLLEMPDPISAGEANVASSELDSAGDLRISFHRGFFSAPGAKEHAAFSAAYIVHDIQSDVVGSFVRAPDGASDLAFSDGQDLKPANEMKILIEETDDDHSFTEMVIDQFKKLDSDACKQIQTVPSLKHAHPLERDRYVAAEPINWNIQTRLDLLARMSQAGHPIERIDPESAFEDVRLVSLSPGDVLIEAGTPSAFVYMPLGPGLKIVPLGGYRSFSIQPWMLLGITGVIRDAERSATVLAEQGLEVLIIPKMPYLKYWHHTLSLEAFRQAVTKAISVETSPTGSMSQLKKSLLLQNVPLFSALDITALTELSSKVNEVHLGAGECLFEKGAIGESLYVVVDGSLRIHDKALVLRELGAGDVFGEMAAITPEPRMASVTANSESHLLRLDQRALNRLTGSNPAVAQGIIEMLASYVRDQVAERVLLQMEREEHDHDV